MYPQLTSIYEVMLPPGFLIDYVQLPNKELDEQSAQIIGQTLTHYRDTLWSTPKVLELLEKHFGFKNLDILKLLKAGYSNRTLTKLFPRRGSLEGESLRGTLTNQDLLKPSGSEVFRWCVTAELQNIVGDLVGLTGFSINRAKVHHPSTNVLFSNASMGILNPKGLRQSHAVLCDETKDVLRHLDNGVNAVGLMVMMDSQDEFIEVLKNADITSAEIQHRNTPMGKYWAKELAFALTELKIEVKPYEV